MVQRLPVSTLCGAKTGPGLDALMRGGAWPRSGVGIGLHITCSHWQSIMGSAWGRKARQRQGGRAVKEAIAPSR